MFHASFLSNLHDILHEISENQRISKPGLYLIGTPIGNLVDISFRALATLQAMDVVFCEDTRVTQKLLSAYGLSKPLKVYHTHNAAKTKGEMVTLIEGGKSVGLVSDAGLPLISDPGEGVLSACIEKQLPVTVIPGASAGVMALVGSGLSAERFQFVGFLPQKEKDRQACLKSIAASSATLIFYEAPHRLIKTLGFLQEALGNRSAAVGRELTKKFENVQRGTLQELMDHYKNNGTVKGEIVIVVEGCGAVTHEGGQIDEWLRLALGYLRVKDAAALVSSMTGTSKKELYERALVLKDDKTADS